MKFYSETLDKIFDTEEELKAAEQEKAEAEAKKAEAKALVQKESAEVQEAFKMRNNARKIYNETLCEAKKAYNEDLREAEKKFSERMKDADAKRDEAEKVFAEKLSAFQKSHPEGYRLNLKDGDNVVTYTSEPIAFKSLNKEFDEMLDAFSNWVRRW